MFEQIPDGWQQITEGPVRLGDRLLSKETERFIDLTDKRLRDLQFLNATIAQDFVCLIRRKR